MFLITFFHRHLIGVWHIDSVRRVHVHAIVRFRR